MSLDLGKRTWYPSPLLGQIVLVTTLNQDGTADLAPKSWVSMMALEPPILAPGCSLQHCTARNILERKEFVINVSGVELPRQCGRALGCRIHVRWRPPG